MIPPFYIKMLPTCAFQLPAKQPWSRNCGRRGRNRHRGRDKWQQKPIPIWHNALMKTG